MSSREMKISPSSRRATTSSTTTSIVFRELAVRHASGGDTQLSTGMDGAAVQYCCGIFYAGGDVCGGDVHGVACAQAVAEAVGVGAGRASATFQKKFRKLL